MKKHYLELKDTLHKMNSTYTAVSGYIELIKKGNNSHYKALEKALTDLKKQIKKANSLLANSQNPEQNE